MNMQVSVEVTNGLERRMTVELPVENLESAVKSKLQALSRNARVKGFRPGKVPFKVLENKYGGEARAEAFNEAIQSSLFEALNQENLRPAGQPNIEPKPLEQGKGVCYVATFEVYPDIEPASVDNVTIEKLSAEINDDDISGVIETIRRQRLGWKPVDRASQDSDQVTIDFTGTIDGEAFDGGSAQAVPLVLGSGNMIDGFEEQLVGKNAGDETTVKVTFPEDYHREAFAGKDAEFVVRINSVAEEDIPEVDEAFIRSFGVADGTEASFRKDITANMQKELAQTINRKLKNQVMDALVEVNDIEVPRALVENESEALLQNMQANLESQGLTELQKAQMDVSMFEDEARKRVTLGLVMGEIIKRQELTVDSEQVKSRVEQLASTYEQPAEVVKWYYSDPNRLSEIESLVLEDKVVAWLLENAKVTDKPQSFNEIMQPGGQLPAKG
ncbi:MAG: trigger factor [Gammaproteobacteria bacterium]|nr:MAG: trigger factor [Gammaproteobacteria bacterium]